MAYLTNQEYKELGYGSLDDTEFSKLVVRASDVLDSITNYFYKFNDINSDTEFRRNQFKKALAAQIEYFNSLGAYTHEAINNAPHSFSAGRTSVTNSKSNKQSGQLDEKSLVANEVYIHLSMTGLLYAGVATL